MLGRLQGAWRELDGDQRLAGLAALALLVTLFLPWYQATVIDRGRATNPTFNAFGVFSFVEAAIFLVALGIFLLLFARGERRGFHLPGGDGTVIFAAGLWAALLLLWRVFDRPDIERAVSDGITWGLFFAFLAAGALAASGWKIRAAGRPEPPLVRDDGGTAGDGPRTEATEVVPRRRRPARPSSPPAAGPSEQLTLEDAAPPQPETEPARPAPEDRTPPTQRPAPPPDEPAPPPEDRTARTARPAPPPEDRTARTERPAPPPEDPAPPPPEPPAPPPIRPGVFDQDASGDEPLRPGEIPRRAPD
jgi:hypothetical protein